MTALSVVFLLLALLTCRWMLLKLRKSSFELHPEEPRADLQDVVSVIVPMRNEEANVDSCLNAIRAQSHAHLQVIVVDDASTDATPQILELWKQRLPGLEVLRLESCPEGWAGKVHAMHRGQERARGEWLFFTDADVELAPDAIARSLATAVERDWPVLSVLGQLVTPSFWEKAIQLPFSAFFLWVIAEAPRATLCGQYVLMRRSLYNQVGGYAAIAGAVADDREMARLLRAHDVQFRAYLWTGAYRSRMFTSAWGIWTGIRRMVAGAARFRSANILGMVLWVLLADLAPFVALAYAIASYPQGGRRALFWMLSAAALILTRWILYQRMLARLRAPGGAFLLKPLADLLAFFLYLDAALRSLTGSVSWKDRRYSRELLSAPVPPRQSAAETRRPASEAPTPPSRSEFRMSVVVETQTSGFWQQQGVGCEEAIAQFFRIAEEHPEVEVIFVSDRPLEVQEPCPFNLRVLASPSPDYYDMKRHGLQHARSDLVAFMDTDVIYPRDYIPQILAPFDDPEVQIVATKMRYRPKDARRKAACIRDWGHLGDDEGSLCHFPSNAFAARRAILERYHFGLGFRRVGGELFLFILCRMDGIGVYYLPNVVTYHEDYYQRLRSAWYKLFEGIPPTVDAVRRAVARLRKDSAPIRLLLRILPLRVALFTAVASVRRYPGLRGGLAIGGWGQVSVPAWLLVLALASFAVALRCVLQPDWLRGKGEEERLTLSPALDEDPHHPLNLALDRITLWVREDPLRLQQVFAPSQQVPARPGPDEESSKEAQVFAKPEVVRDAREG